MKPACALSKKTGETHQQKMLAGLVLGDAYAEQWGEKARKVDFFDIKADVQAIFALTGCDVQFVISTAICVASWTNGRNFIARTVKK